MAGAKAGLGAEQMGLGGAPSPPHVGAVLGPHPPTNVPLQPLVGCALKFGDHYPNQFGVVREHLPCFPEYIYYPHKAVRGRAGRSEKILFLPTHCALA